MENFYFSAVREVEGLGLKERYPRLIKLEFSEVLGEGGELGYSARKRRGCFSGRLIPILILMASSQR